MHGIIEKKFYDDRYEVTCGVIEECHDMRIDLFVQLYFPSFTREFIKKKIDKNQVTILTRIGRVKPSTKIKKWDKIHIVCFRENIEDEYWMNAKIMFEDLSIIHDHEKFCVTNKPPFMCAHPTGRHVFYCATVYAERMLGSQCSTVHRLDRETSGVLVLSKDAEYGNLLSTQFEKHQVQKFYFFIAQAPTNRTIQWPFVAQERIGEDPKGDIHSRLYMQCFPESSTYGKSAKTYFDLIIEGQGFIGGLAMPKTGRQHQIRTHAAFHGLPLVGDKIYANGYTMFQKFKDGLATQEDYEKMMLPRHALHATAIDFLQLNLQPKYFFAPLPLDLLLFVKEKMNISADDLHEKLKNKIIEWQHLLKTQELPQPL